MIINGITLTPDSIHASIRDIVPSTLTLLNND